MENQTKNLELRTHVISDTESQRTVAFQSSAKTFGELKRDLRNLGFNVEGKAISEGITGVEFKGDDSVIPGEVYYKGKKRNSLVFRMTTANKKIESGGIDRGELYQKIKDLGIVEKIKEVTGRNFTQVPTVVLIDFVNNESCDKKEGCAQHKESKEPLELDTLNDMLSYLHECAVRLTDAVNDIMDYVSECDSNEKEGNNGTDLSCDEIHEILGNM